MAKISQDIKDLLDKKPKTIKTTRLVYRLVIILAFIGLVAIIAGAVNSCQDKPPAQSVLEEAK
jgi:hypothetical protein